MARRIRGDLETEPVPVIKAHVVKAPAGASLIEQLFARRETDGAVAGTLEPPYKPDIMIRLWEMSSTLQPNISALVTNIDGFGHRFEPAVDLVAPDAVTRVRESLRLELIAVEEAKIEEAKVRAAQIDRPKNGKPTSPSSTSTPFLDPPEVEDPPDAEVLVRIEKLRRRARVEWSRLQSFFEFCCPGGSFVALRRRTRLDLEITGNAFWEVLRNPEGLPSRLVRAPVASIRLTPLDEVSVEVKELVRVSDLAWEWVPQHRFFRRFVQAESGSVIAWFKEFGDPRTVSARTGRPYKDADELTRLEPGAKPATEMIHFAIPHPDSPYGVPRWVGNVTAVLGSRELDEVNLDYFRSNSVPPLALLVSGGTFKKNVVGTITDFFDSKVKGRGSTHKVVILEAESQRNAGGIAGPAPKITFVPLRDAQQQDALFQQYDERNADKISMSFRLPRILTGRDRTLNRAVAEAALTYAEDQVFNPEREEFDELINRRLLSELKISFWCFKSKGPATRDPYALAIVIAGFGKAGAITPNEARRLASGVFNIDFPSLRDRWADVPLPVLLAQLNNPETAKKLLEDVDRGFAGLVDGASEEAGEAPLEPKPGPDGPRRSTGMAVEPLRGVGEPAEEAQSS